MKYTCTTCRTPFNTIPYVSNQHGLFCQRNCWEQYLADSGYEHARPGIRAAFIEEKYYPGTRIKRA